MLDGSILNLSNCSSGNLPNCSNLLVPTSGRSSKFEQRSRTRWILRTINFHFYSRIMNRINVHLFLIHLPSPTQMQHHAALPLTCLTSHSFRSYYSIWLWNSVKILCVGSPSASILSLIGLAILIHPVSPWWSLLPIITIQLRLDSKW